MWHLCGKVTDILTVQRKLLYTTAVSRRRSYYDSLELSLFRGHAAWLILSGSQMWNNIEIKLQWHCSVSVLLQFYFTLVSRFRHDMQNFDMHMGLTQLSVCCVKQSYVGRQTHLHAVFTRAILSVQSRRAPSGQMPGFSMLPPHGTSILRWRTNRRPPPLRRLRRPDVVCTL